jgi:hypothetical protein
MHVCRHKSPAGWRLQRQAADLALVRVRRRPDLSAGQHLARFRLLAAMAELAHAVKGEMCDLRNPWLVLLFTF